MKPYYNKNTKTYEFVDKFKLISVFFTFSIDIKTNIIARDITARDIKAGNIKSIDINAGNINAWDIKSRDIFFYAICSAKRTLKCKTIKGTRKNAKYFCLGNEVEFIKANNNSLKELNL